MSISTITWQLIPVLSDVYTQEIKTMEVHTAMIKDKKLTGKLIAFLNTKFPNQNIIHLKRVNSIKNTLEIILAPTTDNILHQILQDLNCEGLSDAINTPSTTIVPTNCTKTRKQFEASMKLWPLANFCADKYIESVLNDSLFSLCDKVKLENLMRIALQAGLKSKRLGGKGIGAVISQEYEVLAVGCDARNLHPLKHATMAALDMIAWQRQSQSYPAPEWLGLDISDHNTALVTSPSAYLCTDYDIFLTREPCTMCAMALLHNRFKRIFYACSYKYGALGTTFKLHTLPDTNHRFEVFAGILQRECKEVISDIDIKCKITHTCFC